MLSSGLAKPLRRNHLKTTPAVIPAAAIQQQRANASVTRAIWLAPMS